MCTIRAGNDSRCTVHNVMLRAQYTNTTMIRARVLGPFFPHRELSWADLSWDAPMLKVLLTASTAQLTLCSRWKPKQKTDPWPSWVGGEFNEKSLVATEGYPQTLGGGDTGLGEMKTGRLLSSNKKRLPRNLVMTPHARHKGWGGIF